jgi:hypothetical protein
MKTNGLLARIVSAALVLSPTVAMAQDQKFVLEEGTKVELVLAETISSADERVGNTVGFEVVEDVMVGNTVVIPRGASAWGTITVAESKKRMGRGGKLDVNVDKVRLADGEKVLLSAVQGGKGGGHTGAMVGAMVVTSLIIWPAAPLFLLMHGKDITIPKGTRVVAYIRGDANLDPAKFTAQASAPKPLPVPAPEVPVTGVVATNVSTGVALQSEAVAPAQPSTVVADQQPLSLGDAARKNREKKLQQQQAQAEAQPQ